MGEEKIKCEKCGRLYDNKKSIFTARAYIGNICFLCSGLSFNDAKKKFMEFKDE